MAVNPSAAAVTFPRAVERDSGQPVARCYQCQKCSAGCPLSFAADLKIHQVVRLVQLGLKDEALSARAIWLCTGCKTCQARCPNEIDGARVTDALRVMALRERRPAEKAVKDFHFSFLLMVELLGRAYEVGLILLQKLLTRNLTQDLGLGLRMMARGKLRLLPSRAPGAREVARIFQRARELQ
ncbi:MAG: 4Fe-4S dicluster domain-containing protein [Acetobacteraceae bacterium]|nr:4Fe-4S dicluster domain-containing protein [Acetobacteraceae bacterium]